MSSVLITGAAGFVGSHVVEHFLNHSGFDVIGIDSFRHMGDAERISTDTFRCQWIYHDLNAPISDRTSAKIGDVSLIINCASLSHVDTSITDPIQVWENNTRLIGNILEFARRQKNLDMFIQCSTDEVFGPIYDRPYSEWDRNAPSNPYAASKAAQDNLCIAYWRTFGVPTVITHTMNMIGPKQDPEKFLPMIVSKIARDEEITVHGVPGDMGSRMYLDVRDAAEAWLKLSRVLTPASYPSSAWPDKFNIAGSAEISNLELVEMVAGKMGRHPRVKFQKFGETRPGHDKRYGLIDNKIRKSIGWQSRPIGSTIKEVIDHVVNNPEWGLKSETL